jgi:transcriptional regulator with XRE-family HTH domain
VSEQSLASLAETLVRLRRKSGLTQAQVALRMATTQTAVARLERGRQSPTMQTLQNYARANGFCLEIAFVQGADTEAATGCILIMDSREPVVAASQTSGPLRAPQEA